MRAIKVAPELKATDWILERWAISVGDGLYGIPWQDVPHSKVPPLNDQMAIVVDQLVLRAGDQTQRLIGYWYRTSLAKTVIARKLHLDRDTIYVRWNAALWYFRGRFLDSPLSDLRLIASTDLGDVLRLPQRRITKTVANNSTLESDIGAKCGNCLRALQIA
jgi:hypothetical protein